MQPTASLVPELSPEGENLHAAHVVVPCMIVEDEPGIRSIISRTLAGYGLTAGEFTGAQEAIGSLAKEHPRVIFLDVSLEGSDAIDAIRGLAERKYSGAVQLISGRMPDVLTEIKKIGERHGLRMRCPIAKPFTADAIRTVVQEECLAAPAASEHPVALGEALRKGWLELWYQPKIDLQKRTLAGAEGLSRVRHPDHGLIAPKAFINNATPTELAELTAVVMTTALRDWSIFYKGGINPKLAVNIPGSVMLQLPLATIIRDYRPKDENWPGLILEVTETEILQDVDSIREIATQLSLYKVGLSIDDFGSGYSSIKRLYDLPCIELKLDAAFVQDCAENERNSTICSTVINLGHGLGVTVTAEGIEKTSELQALKNMGCDFGQGFLLSPPVERDQLIATAQQRPKIKSGRGDRSGHTDSLRS
jgi:EAL domain-containing protein (putative c-di-GMP-specific phosphodiesterase class I)/CheY-like chemotaxis protein